MESSSLGAIFTNIESNKMFGIMMAMKKFVPSVRADDEELIDPQVVLRAECSTDKHIAAFKSKYEECNRRVNSRKKTEETCAEELMDYMHHLDHCVAKKLFSYLK